MDIVFYLLILLFIVSIIFNFKLFNDLKKIDTQNLSINSENQKNQLESISNSKSNEIKYQETINNLKLNQLNEINELKEKHRNELKVEFDEGVKKGIELSKLEVRVTPIKRAKKERSIPFRKEIIEIGYSYRLFSNNLPCLDPHYEILEKIEIKEINEKFIDLVNEKFNQIMDKVPNTNFVLTESIESFTSKLLNKEQ